MTKKDYVRIAAALNGARVTDSEIISAKALYNNGVDNAAHRIADALADDNPKFDRARFMAACGVQS